MSSNIHNEEHDPVANLTMLPARSILKTSRSIDDNRLTSNLDPTALSTTGMKRSESRCNKIPHFDEMNIIATYHPVDKDYGHMKIEEPRTPYAPSDNFDEDMDVGAQNHQTMSSSVDPNALTHRLNESSHRLSADRSAQRATNEDLTQSEHHQQFEHHRKEHYNEFEIVRFHKKEIEAELRALEQEEALGSHSPVPIKPILVSSPSSSHRHLHHVHVSDDDQHERDEQSLTAEERERRKQFELKRKQHYNEFHVARSTNNDDDN